jgi:hypothetical protein
VWPARSSTRAIRAPSVSSGAVGAGAVRERVTEDDQAQRTFIHVFDQPRDAAAMPPGDDS